MVGPQQTMHNIIGAGGNHARMFICEDVCALVNVVVDSHKYGLRRGDMVVMESESGYRSQGLYFFDGKQLINQDRSYDDYGTVPEEFRTVEEFPPGYWDLANYEEKIDVVDFSAKKYSYRGGTMHIVPATVKECTKVYWHGSETVSVLHTGPDAKIKILSTGKFTYNGCDTPITTISHAGEKYLIVGSNIDSTVNTRTYVSWIMDSVTKKINHKTLLAAVGDYNVPPENILVIPGMFCL